MRKEGRGKGRGKAYAAVKMGRGETLGERDC